jgi:hypothetical protein
MLAEWGLPYPTVPAPLAGQMHQVARGVFGTRDEFEFSPYAIEHWFRETVAGEVPSYALVAHAGHGVNSWAIHYFLVTDRLRLFLQVPWGGVYMDKATSTAAVAESFRIANELVEAVAGVPEAAWPGHGSVTLMASGFYGSTLTVPAASDINESNDRSRTEWRDPDTLEPLQAALAWVESMPR